MSQLAMTEQFIRALASLDGADAKRVAAFLDRLVRQPGNTLVATEIVHDAGDRTIRSMRVTRDLRAIVALEDDRIVLLFVAHHDAAYAWAREHCVRCRPLDGALEVVAIGTALVASAAPVGVPGHVECVVDSTGSLCEVLDARGVAHELTQ